MNQQNIKPKKIISSAHSETPTPFLFLIKRVHLNFIDVLSIWLFSDTFTQKGLTMESHLTYRKISSCNWQDNRHSISQTEGTTSGSPFCHPFSMTWTFPELLSYRIKVNPKLPRSNILLLGCSILEKPQYPRYFLPWS